jgi:hypothetical protein
MAYITQTSATGAAAMPYGNTAQRPGSPSTGYTRINTETGSLEYYTGSTWATAAGVYSAYYLIVAGGGGGGGTGGGGAGGYIENSAPLTPGTTYTITVGSGGSANTNGSNSSAFSITATGGGTAATTGGSGGGANYGAASTVGSGTSPQGYSGGIASYEPGPNYCSGGGGAAQVA